MRLPAKVLLPLAGVSLAILCAKRLGNTGHEVVLATSSDATDDALFNCATRANVRVLRGSLDDVLDRFVTSVEDLADDDIVVRATADNPVPDGAFVDFLVESFLRQNVPYLGTNSPSDGLPYGLSAEVFTAGALRERARVAESSFEREHVTSTLRLSEGSRSLQPGELLHGNYASRRCTIDTFDDFVAMAGVFELCDEPIGAPWQSFIESLPRIEEAVVSRKSANGRDAPSAIMLGTAQLGSAYGIANRHGYPTDEEARSTLEFALSRGICFFDTARSYGSAESRIGSVLDRVSPDRTCVVTKLMPLTDLDDNATDSEVARFLDASLFHSCHALRRRRLDVVMFHRSADMFRWGGAALDRLEHFSAERIVGEIGVSVYSPDEAILCIADNRIKHLQIPFNLLDKRWLQKKFTEAVRQRPDLKIHVRSIFLQGLLISASDVWPNWFDSSESVIHRIVELAKSLKRRNPADLCMAYVRSFPWVTTLVLGVDTRAQLEELLEYLEVPALTASEVQQVQSSLPDVPERLLNPGKWR
jgi:spore coat polysaccharide biosynthesis protein SpsF